MKKVIRLTESELISLVKRIINEQQSTVVDKCMSDLEDWKKQNPTQKLQIPEVCYKLPKSKDDRRVFLECMTAMKSLEARFAEPKEKFMGCRKQHIMGLT
jgi:hypothetical protein